ncbi:protein of unknown function [Pararobbsia alpina]
MTAFFGKVIADVPSRPLLVNRSCDHGLAATNRKNGIDFFFDELHRAIEVQSTLA